MHCVDLVALRARGRVLVCIQLAVQNKTTQEYAQSVTRIVNEIGILGAQTASTMMGIDAAAQAHAALIANRAASEGIRVTQAAKAQLFARLGKTLHLSNELLLRYVQIRAIREHQGANVTLGVQFAP